MSDDALYRNPPQAGQLMYRGFKYELQHGLKIHETLGVGF
jgi:hypothetical protein